MFPFLYAGLNFKTLPGDNKLCIQKSKRYTYVFFSCTDNKPSKSLKSSACYMKYFLGLGNLLYT